MGGGRGAMWVKGGGIKSNHECYPCLTAATRLLLSHSRFQPVTVPEPTIEETFEILQVSSCACVSLPRNGLHEIRLYPLTAS